MIEEYVKMQGLSFEQKRHKLFSIWEIDLFS